MESNHLNYKWQDTSWRRPLGRSPETEAAAAAAGRLSSLSSATDEGKIPSRRSPGPRPTWRSSCRWAAAARRGPGSEEWQGSATGMGSPACWAREPPAACEERRRRHRRGSWGWSPRRSVSGGRSSWGSWLCFAARRAWKRPSWGRWPWRQELPSFSQLSSWRRLRRRSRRSPWASGPLAWTRKRRHERRSSGTDSLRRPSEWAAESKVVELLATTEVVLLPVLLRWCYCSCCYSWWWLRPVVLDRFPSTEMNRDKEEQLR